jgi:hypothetical protein
VLELASGGGPSAAYFSSGAVAVCGGSVSRSGFPNGNEGERGRRKGRCGRLKASGGMWGPQRAPRGEQHRGRTATRRQASASGRASAREVEAGRLTKLGRKRDGSLF